jgi:signal transduction histidine kinase
MTPLTRFLRPFVVWATDLTDKYRYDPKVRTTAHIIFLQVGLTLLSIFVFGWAIQYAQQDTVGEISEHVREVITGVSTSRETLPESIVQVRNRTYSIVFTGLVLLNLLFGYLIAEFALRPTRQNLAFQKRFIGNVAHEIRTPLAIIKTSTEVALLDPALPKPIRQTMEEIIGELNRISDTINNLLSFNSLMRPKEMRFGPVDLDEIVRTVCERHEELAQSRGVTLSCAPLAKAIVQGNAVALDQVVTNLVKNAINYTPAHKNGSVRVELERLPDRSVAVAVADTGIGIAEKDLYHIFEPFYRADTSRARGIGTGNSGLGLAIVNEIVRLHRGTITLRSAVHHGTTIRVTLPPAKESRRDPLQMAPSGSPHEARLDFS